jgi:hypothetical protein
MAGYPDNSGPLFLTLLIALPSGRSCSTSFAGFIHNSARCWLHCERPASSAMVISSWAMRSSIVPTSGSSTKMLNTPFADGFRRSKQSSESTPVRRWSRFLAVSIPICDGENVKKILVFSQSRDIGRGLWIKRALAYVWCAFHFDGIAIASDGSTTPRFNHLSTL